MQKHAILVDMEFNERYLQTSLLNVEKDFELSQRNKDIMLNYIRESMLGKTIKKGQKKVIGAGRNRQVLGILNRMCKQWFKKDLDAVTMQDMEKFILDLDKGVIKTSGIKKRSNNLRNASPESHNDLQRPYSSETKKNIKKFLKKFYKHIEKPELVEWVDTSGADAQIQAVPKLDKGVWEIVELIPDIRRKALIWALFDSGFREGEIVSCKIGDIERRPDGIYYLTCRYSKTKPRTVSLPYASELLERWLQKHPFKDDRNAQLWQTSRAMMYKTVKTYGMKAHKINVTPHIIRHTSATFYAPKLDRVTFCKRFGWSYKSPMPDRYIDFAKVEENKVVDIVKADKYHEVRLELENQKLKNLEMAEQLRNMEKGMEEQLSKLREEFKNHYIDKAKSRL